MDPFELAREFIEHTSVSVFLTGKAGTGKTTFLQQIRANCPKPMVVVAPTGVAAIHAGGVTLHALFGLPFSPYLPGFQAERHLLSQARLTRQKRQLLQSLHLLVIDEISMVRCDVLDAVDALCRHARQNSNPFGGLQLLMIGDLHQLPPVVKEHEWQLLQSVYSAPFFFNSQVISKMSLTTIELTTVYRQQDHLFINLLNEVRNNQLSADNFDRLNSRYHPQPTQVNFPDYITLTTHNKNADLINQTELARLPGSPVAYEAQINGDFPESMYPADLDLKLKVGCQVMFLKNDTLRKRYYNGKIGKVVALGDGEVDVACADELITVTAEAWENNRFSIDEAAGTIVQTSLGSFLQIPLRLAWAVTIHKSQGLTFDKVIVDAASAFTAGQTYVALSRCTRLEGLVLSSKIPYSAISTDQRVLDYQAAKPSSKVLASALLRGKIAFQQFQLLQIFDTSVFASALHHLAQTLLQAPLSTQTTAWFQSIKEPLEPLLQVVSKFTGQLHKYFAEPSLPEQNEQLLQRLCDAAQWLMPRFKDIEPYLFSKLPDVDNKDLAKQLEVQVNKLQQAQTSLILYLESLIQGYDPQLIIRLSSQSNIVQLLHQKRTNLQEVSAGPFSSLLARLTWLRNELADSHQLDRYLVASTAALEAMAKAKPRSLNALKRIPGFGETRTRRFGDSFVTVIDAWCNESGELEDLELLEGFKKPKKKQASQSKKDKPSTYVETWKLFEAGLQIVEIAQQRNLTMATIEGHLVQLIINKALPVKTLLSTEAFEIIAAEIKINPSVPIGEIRNRLNQKFSFAQIKLATYLISQELSVNGAH